MQAGRKEGRKEGKKEKGERKEGRWKAEKKGGREEDKNVYPNHVMKAGENDDSTLGSYEKRVYYSQSINM